MAFYNPQVKSPTRPPPVSMPPSAWGSANPMWRNSTPALGPWHAAPTAQQALSPPGADPYALATKVKSAAQGIAAKGQPPAAPYGSESGPGILESWFNQRANGTDPAYEYAMNRGGDAIDTRMAAGGSFNSGARGQQLSDFAANMAAQRMGQLDTLAGGASGEHMGRLGMMFNQGLGLANGQAGAGTAYDTAAAGNMAASAEAQRQLALGKAGVDSKANQGLLNNAFNAYSIYKMGSGGGGGGNGGYTSVDGGAGNPYPQY